MTKQTEQLSYFGSIVAFFSGMTWSDIASICGILFGFSTLLIGWYYKHKEYELRRLALEKPQKDEQ
ncbi:hypothetical protein A4G18_07540 [Pasteurellaceae bacterium Pebbles2]|nr:hypothetical protein [Pasteurellaceae bacterium Pebbles2]